jgi:hypothetical protein
VCPRDQLGRPRTRANGWPASPEPAVEGPAVADPAARLETLTVVLRAPTQAPALVAAAVAHGELLAVRPFTWGNVLVGLAAQRLVLRARGFDPDELGAPEVGHARLGIPAYLAAAGGYAVGTPDGVAAWLRHCARAVTLGAQEGLAVCEALRRS